MSRNAAHTLHGFAPDVTEMVPVTIPERLDELQRRYDVGPPIGEGGTPAAYGRGPSCGADALLDQLVVMRQLVGEERPWGRRWSEAGWWVRPW